LLLYALPIIQTKTGSDFHNQTDGTVV